MNRFPSKDVVDSVKRRFPPGTRVELISMDDPYGKLNPGDRATVTGVDDIATVHCTWDCGSSLGLAYGEDKFRKLTEQEIAEEQNQSEQSYGGMNMS